MKPKFSDLWRWNGDLGRGTFFFWGLLLAIIKFNLDRLIGLIWFDQSWSAFKWSTLQFYLWQSPWDDAARPYFLTLLVVSLPFLWTGTVLTLRRLRALGYQPFWVFLFFVPVLKLFLFAFLCVLNSKTDASAASASDKWVQHFGRCIPSSAMGSALVAIFLTVVLALLGAWLGTEIFRDYGWSIFVGLPFCMGFLSALIHGFHAKRSVGRCILVANLTVSLVGAAFLLLAWEGIICLLMAAPIAYVVATIGGLLGYLVQSQFFWREDSPRLFCSLLVLAPLVMGIEHAVPPALPLLPVKTSVIVNAPPEKVWKHVISFTELPPPNEMIFKLGVAYPIRAEIFGRGAGAVRHCNFSTGPFVEPIEVWDEPCLLKFSVTKNPEPMQEWTPYRDIHPAHLDGYLESKAGQFRLIPLGDGSTLLEGTTWYQHRLWPSIYWQPWSDHIIHTIHTRVLNHVKVLSEQSP
jgi:uncharacterized membrane protein YhaH (DUF805 family)